MNASEGKLRKQFKKLFGIDLLEYETQLQIQDYAKPRYVPGLAEVAMGFRPLYPMTVYVISGDPTSGIAGMLKPDGEFIPTASPKKVARFWVHEETDFYMKVRNSEGSRVVGYSWRKGEVVWDGSVAGSINVLGEDGDGDPVYRREWDGSLGTEWITTGELWRAIARGTAQSGRKLGQRHMTLADWESYNGHWGA